MYIRCMIKKSKEPRFLSLRQIKSLEKKCCALSAAWWKECPVRISQDKNGVLYCIMEPIDPDFTDDVLTVEVVTNFEDKNLYRFKNPYSKVNIISELSPYVIVGILAL